MSQLHTKETNQWYNELTLFTVKPVLSGHLKRISNFGFQYRSSPMKVESFAECLLEHSAILLTCIKLPSLIESFVLSVLSGRLRQV